MKWMLYGANGYTAKIALQQLDQLSITPIVAGRNKEAIATLADQYGLEGRSFALDSHSTLVKMLEDVDLVINCAGPFSQTFAYFAEACLESKTHYADITGEISVFEHAHSLHHRAKEAGVVLIPGVGFDIIPTDCMAAMLKARMPNATALRLGFSGGKHLSPGTAKSSVEAMGGGMLVRREGKIKRVMRNFEARNIKYAEGVTKPSMVIPWGDVYTAYVSTGIGNIQVYIPGRVSNVSAWIYRLIRPIFKLGFVQSKMKQKIDKTVSGPDQDARDAKPTLVWGEVSDASGQTLVGRFTTPNGYSLTADGIVLTANFFANYNGEGGYLTPSLLFGADVVLTLPGVTEPSFEES